MAQDFVQIAPDSTGKNVQSFVNPIGANNVEVCPVVPINPAGYANDFIEVGQGSGKNVQQFSNTIGGITVYALAVCPVGTAGT